MNLLSLFDYSGQWSYPFAKRGWNVYQWDIKISEFMDINNIGSVEEALDLFEDVDGLLIAPPCTEFTVSCAQYWPMKDADGRTAAAMRLVEQSLKLVDLFTPTDPDYEDPFFWVLENPVGRLSKLIPAVGKPIYFDPWEFAGHLEPSEDILQQLSLIRMKDGKNITKEECELVVKWEAYTKKTGLWGVFNHDMQKKPIEPVKGAPQGSFTQRLGGKSAKTKEERSNTPKGFAEAFCMANHNWTGWKDQING